PLLAGPSSPNDHIHHGAGCGTTSETLVDRAHHAIAAILLLPWLHRVDVHRAKNLQAQGNPLPAAPSRLLPCSARKSTLSSNAACDCLSGSSCPGLIAIGVVSPLRPTRNYGNFPSVTHCLNLSISFFCQAPSHGIDPPSRRVRILSAAALTSSYDP